MYEGADSLVHQFHDPSDCLLPTARPLSCAQQPQRYTAATTPRFRIIIQDGPQL